MDGTTQMAAGSLLVLAGGVIVLGILGGIGPEIPPLAGAAAMFVMAAGSLLIGISGEDGRPV
jgi:hypothetical protein